ncbi:PHP domain-containing protein [Dehalococcoidales bacterium]|nr:PHP domain-containing protein [Dehalococcoidales bacterium]
MTKVDLHIHSTASDGSLSPADIVHKSVEQGLSIIAIADHDSVAGIVPALVAAKAFPQLRVIPCVEISTDVPDGEVHVLGYFIDYTSYELLTTLEKLRHSRRERAQGMIAKLRDLGIHIEWQRVQEIAGSGAIGRPHLAQAMLEKGYVTSVKEAFTNYINQGGPAYVEREKMTPVAAVELILKANGLPVLAHPLTINEPEMMIVELKAAGLVGIEAYYDGYTTEEINKLVSLAARHNLIASGGSDYHGLDANTETMIGGVNMPEESAEQLIALAEQRGLT